MTVTALQALAQTFTERLLNTAAEGLIIAGLVWVLLRLAGRQNSGTRFAIWFSALLAIVVLPFSGASRVAAHFRSLTSGVPYKELTLSSSWAFYLFAAWAIGAGLLLLKLGIGLWRVRQIRRNCSAVDLAAVDPAIRCLAQDNVSRRRVSLCVSSDVAVPGAIGFVRPAIIFPAWLFPRLSVEEIKMILLHEMAHLRRWDDWTNLAQKIVKAVFFFHPAVWWIENRLTLEREMACDDRVLAQTSSPRAYAASLISFAEKLHAGRGLALAQALLSRVHQTSQRVAQILDAKRSNRLGLGKWAIALSAGMLAAALCASPSMPRVVRFATPQDQNAADDLGKAAPVLNAGPEASPAAGVTPSIPTLHSRVVPAGFHPRTAVIRRQQKVASAREPAGWTATPARENRRGRATFVIVQTAQYGTHGSGVWTFCIWRVGNNRAERELQSTIFISSI